jgi:hypothetical protein
MTEVKLSEALAEAVERVKRMTPDEREAMMAEQGKSWVRGMAPCEHGVSDWEQCPDCRARRLALSREGD